MTTARRSGTAAALVLAVAATLAPAPAGAEDGGGAYDVPTAQALVWPLPLGTTLVIDGPANVWQLRTFAEAVDQSLPGVGVVTGSAADHPGTFVVTVVKSYRPDADFAGFTDWQSPSSAAYPTGATVTLNTYYRGSPRQTRRQVAAHELMHVLGFRHHAGEGIAGAEPPLTLEPTPSPEEWVALHAYYG